MSTTRVTAMPMAATGPRPRVEFMSAASRQSMPEDHRAAAGQHRGPGTVHRLGHGLVPVAVQPQFLAVAGDQQEGVVGAGADDQDGEDARALGVDGQVGVAGEQVDQRLRAVQRDHGREDRQDPQDRAAVGEQQDQDHDAEGGEEQGAVDAGERLGGVGRVARPGPET